MSWYLPMRDISPKMKGITFSKKLLNIIGYEMDEAPTEVDKYREFAFEYLSPYLVFWMERTTRKFISTSCQLSKNLCPWKSKAVRRKKT